MAKSWLIKKHLVFPGDRFGHLLVLSHDEAITGQERFYLCRCECGKKKSLRGCALRRGRVKSCGCKTVKMRTKKVRKPDHSSAVNSVYTTYKRKAADRDWEFNLPLVDFRRMIASRCSYCGEEKSNSFKVAGVYFSYNGIDRVDSSKGYTLDNSVPCCVSCNRAKLAMSRDNFLSWVERVASHQRSAKTVSVIKSYFVVMMAHSKGPEATVDPSLNRADVVGLIRSAEATNIIFIHEISGSRIIDRTAELVGEALSGTDRYAAAMKDVA